MHPANALRMHPDVVLVERPDGTSWLLHMSANTIRLDADATELLHSILGRGPDDAARELAQRFDVDEGEVRNDVTGFVANLRKQRLLVDDHDTHDDRVIARRVIDAMLAVVDRSPRRPRRRAWMLLLVARVSVAMFGWAATVRAWERRYRQPATSHHDPDALERIDTVVRETAARSLLHHECKERGLACLAMARGAGIAADLLVGLTYSPLAAHVWVECDGCIISDLPEHCAPFEPVMRYDGNAR